MGMLPGRALKSENPVYLDPVQILPSPATGIFYPRVDRGSYVEKDTVLAHITDYFGQTIGEIRAPFAGIVLYIIGTPPVSQGNPAAFIGAVRR
jgi:predicted deacylase